MVATILERLSLKKENNHCRIATKRAKCLGPFATFITVCMREYTPEWDILCIDVTVWASLTVTRVLLGLNMIPYTPKIKNYHIICQ